jgi:hypothetical protein
MKILKRKDKLSSELQEQHKACVESYFEGVPSEECLERVLGPRDHVPTDIDSMMKRVNPNFENMFDEMLVPKVGIYRHNCAMCTTAMALQLKGYNAESLPVDIQHSSKTALLAANYIASSTGDKHTAFEFLGHTFRGYDDVFDVDYSNHDNTLFGSENACRSNFADNPYVIDNIRTPASRKLHLDDRAYDVSISAQDRIPYHMRNIDTMMESLEDCAKSWGPGAFGDISVIWRARGAGGHSMLFYNEPMEDGTTNLTIIDSQTNKKYVTSEEKYGLFIRTDPNGLMVVRLDNAKIKSDCELALRRMCKPGEAYTQSECQSQIVDASTQATSVEMMRNSYAPKESDFVIHGICEDDIQTITEWRNSTQIQNESKVALHLRTIEPISSSGTLEVHIDNNMLKPAGVNEDGKKIYDAHFRSNPSKSKDDAGVYNIETYSRYVSALGYNVLERGRWEPQRLAESICDYEMTQGGKSLNQPLLAQKSQVEPQAETYSEKTNASIAACMTKASSMSEEHDTSDYLLKR